LARHEKNLVAAGFGGTCGGGWWYFKHQKPEAPEYTTEVVQKGDTTQVVTATGTLKPVINVTVGCQSPAPSSICSRILIPR
jgi:HlyD family secretion protein